MFFLHYVYPVKVRLLAESVTSPLSYTSLPSTKNRRSFTLFPSEGQKEVDHTLHIYIYIYIYVYMFIVDLVYLLV